VLPGWDLIMVDWTSYGASVPLLEQGTLHTARTLSEAGGSRNLQRRDGLQSLAVASDSTERLAAFHRKANGGHTTGIPSASH